MASISAYDKMSYNNVNLPSLQEMMVAPSYMQQQHDAALEESAKISAEANLAANLAMEDPNSKAASAYQAYVGDLNKATELLTSKGLKGSNIKAALSSARGRYTGEIMPIIKAGEVREKDKAILNQLSLADPSIIMDVDPTQYTIDAYIGRGNTSYVPTAVSGKALEDATANAVKHLQDQIQADPKRIFSNTNLPFEYMARINRGATPAEVEAAMRQEGFDGKDVNTMTSMLRNAVESSLKSHGVYEKFANRPDLIEKAWTNASRGLYAAIGKPDIQFKTDSYGMQSSLMVKEAGLKPPPEEEPINTYRQGVIGTENKDVTKKLQMASTKLENLYKKYLDPKVKIAVSKEDIIKNIKEQKPTSIDKETGAPITRITGDLKTKSDYLQNMRKVAKEYGYDIFGLPDEKGVRKLKPLSIIKEELAHQIRNASTLRNVDILDINTPEATDAFLSKISTEKEYLKDKNGKPVKLSKFIISGTDSFGNMTSKALKQGVVLGSDPRTKKVVLIAPDGTEAHLNLDEFPTIKTAFEEYHKTFVNDMFGYTNQMTGERYDYETHVDLLNGMLEETGRGKFKLDRSKYDLEKTEDQLKLANDMAEKYILLRREELLPTIQQEYDQLPEETKKRISQYVYTEKRLLEARQGVIRQMINGATFNQTTPITDVVSIDLLNSTTLQKTPVKRK